VNNNGYFRVYFEVIASVSCCPHKAHMSRLHES